MLRWIAGNKEGEFFIPPSVTTLRGRTHARLARGVDDGVRPYTSRLNSLAAMGRLDLLANAVHADHAVDVPILVVAVELDLDVGQAVERDPLLERLRQAVADWLLHVRRFEGIDVHV